MPATNTTTEDSTGSTSRDDDPLPPRTLVTVLTLTLAALLSPFACDSAKLLAMRGRTAGTIESVSVRRGGHGTSAPEIHFSYTVDGRRYVSDQFSPGVFSRGTWTGGGNAAVHYRAGQAVQVHYDPRRPDDACVAYGWHCWSLGLPLFAIGLGLQGWGSRQSGRRARIAQAIGWTMVPLAVICFSAIREVLRPSDLPVAAAIAAPVFAASVLYWSLKRL